jgi:hypothetical protein
MITISTRPANGVSYSVKHTITAGEASDGSILFDFQNSLNLTAVVQILDASGLAVDMTGVGVSFPDTGQVQVDDAGTPVFVEDGIILLVGGKYNSETTDEVVVET